MHILILFDFLESIITRAILFTKVAGWELDDPQYLAVCDNNRVFFECLLEQVTIVVSSMMRGSVLSHYPINLRLRKYTFHDKPLIVQAYAERNTEGLEDRTWEQALAPR